MAIPNREESDKNKGIRAYKKGKSDRRWGKKIYENPFEASDEDNGPKLFENWRSGWKTMDAAIKAGKVDPHIQRQVRE